MSGERAAWGEDDVKKLAARGREAVDSGREIGDGAGGVED